MLQSRTNIHLLVMIDFTEKTKLTVQIRDFSGFDLKTVKFSYLFQLNGKCERARRQQTFAKGWCNESVNAVNSIKCESLKNSDEIYSSFIVTHFIRLKCHLSIMCHPKFKNVWNLRCDICTALWNLKRFSNDEVPRLDYFFYQLMIM